MNVFKKASALVAAIAITFGLAGIVRAAPTTVNLGTTEPFAILSGTPNITDSPTSVITGNVGMSPGPGSGIGLTCLQVTGTIYAVDGTGDPCFTVNGPLLVTAKNDLITAYDDAAGRTPVITAATELGGTTKTAGVYGNSPSTTFEITAGAGPLILDGQGNPNAVFIFNMASGSTGLIVGPGSEVRLTGQAQACNVFWRLNTATIDTTAVFKGNILALTSITVANGANIEGRLLARNGNVTLINDTITRPTCTVASSTGTTPTLPNTGVAPADKGTSWNVIIPAGLLTVALLFIAARRKKII